MNNYSFKDFLDDLFDFPRNILAWIVFHMARWLDMRVVPNRDDIFECLYDEIEDISMEEIEEDNEI